MVRLVISDNEGTTTVVPLVRDEITIGRKEGNTIRLTERNISRQHAQLLRQDGVHKLRDLDSYNGVLINGRRVQGESDVKSGDQIQIGDYTILVEEEAVKASVVSADAPTTVSKRPVTPARFIMLSEPSPGAEFALPPDRSAKLGRSEDVDCPINHRSVSREHAEVRAEATGYTLNDLGSANGVTVNGNAVKQHNLASGDIVELGQVVFRYVGPGEHYFFDPAEAARYRKASGGKRANLRIAAIVLACAAAVAVGIMMSGGEEAPSETTTALKNTPATAAPTAGATIADDGYDKAVSECRAAVAGSRFAEAIAHATLALKVRPDATDATACKAQAQTQYEEEQSYVRGKAALQAGDAEAAYQEFSRLGATSAFQARPEVADAGAQVARARLSKARAQVQSAPAEATRLAQSVLSLPGISAATTTIAQQILNDAHRVAAAAPPPTAARAQAHAARTFPAAAREPAPSKPAPAPAAAAGGAAMDVASACLGRGDNDCVIRALAGKANSAQELGLLIETYRATGDSKQAQKNMAVYVKRFPTARRADAYRRMLELQGQ